MTSAMLRCIVFVCGLWLCVVQASPFVERLHVHEGEEDSSFDWRTKGVISPVQNQGMIGSVLAYVITEEVESLHAIQTGQLTRLSVHEFADCCDVHLASGFDCVVRIGGLCTDAAYPASMGKCNNGSCVPVGKVTGTVYIPEGREDMMLEAIHLVPLAVLVDASHLSFQEYSSGIYSDQSCSTKQLDHALQLVGYGQEGGVDYWIAKNSWGANWGERGYIRILRGKNMCGIATLAFYPVNKP